MEKKRKTKPLYLATATSLPAGQSVLTVEVLVDEKATETAVEVALDEAERMRSPRLESVPRAHRIWSMCMCARFVGMRACGWSTHCCAHVGDGARVVRCNPLPISSRMRREQHSRCIA
jgi:hypothetical protein